MENKFTVLLVGGIGVGKTTLLSQLNTYFNEEIVTNLGPVKIYPEPLDRWENFCGVNMLDKMYRDPKRYAFEFQTLAAATKEEQLRRIRGFSIVERGIQCQKSVFLPLLKESQSLEQYQFELLDMILDSYLEKPIFRPDLLIRCKCSPGTAFERIQTRNRQGEDEIRIGYLRKIEEKYDIMFEKWTVSEKLEIDTGEKITEKTLDKIREKILETYEKGLTALHPTSNQES